MYDFVSGPMVWISFGLFIAGLIVQSFRFFGSTKAKAKLGWKPHVSFEELVQMMVDADIALLKEEHGL